MRSAAVYNHDGASLEVSFNEHLSVVEREIAYRVIIFLQIVV
jgi:hypothetical protein